MKGIESANPGIPTRGTRYPAATSWTMPRPRPATNAKRDRAQAGKHGGGGAGEHEAREAGSGEPDQGGGQTPASPASPAPKAQANPTTGRG